MNRSLVLVGVAVTAAGGYAIACWLSRMTVWAERRDRERYGTATDVTDSQQRVAPLRAHASLR